MSVAAVNSTAAEINANWSLVRSTAAAAFSIRCSSSSVRVTAVSSAQITVAVALDGVDLGQPGGQRRGRVRRARWRSGECLGGLLDRGVGGLGVGARRRLRVDGLLRLGLGAQR